MLQVIPILNDSLASVITIAVGNISPNLSSKNREINQAAIDIIDALINNMGKKTTYIDKHIQINDSVIYNITFQVCIFIQSIIPLGLQCTK